MKVEQSSNLAEKPYKAIPSILYPVGGNSNQLENIIKKELSLEYNKKRLKISCILMFYSSIFLIVFGTYLSQPNLNQFIQVQQQISSIEIAQQIQKPVQLYLHNSPRLMKLKLYDETKSEIDIERVDSYEAENKDIYFYGTINQNLFQGPYQLEINLNQDEINDMIIELSHNGIFGPGTLSYFLIHCVAFVITLIYGLSQLSSMFTSTYKQTAETKNI